MDYKTCTIAGCRPTRFKWKYKEHNEGCQRLKNQIREQLALLCEQGVRRFLMGGSLGVDLWAGDILLELKEQYNDIELILVLPYAKHDRDWDKPSVCVASAQFGSAHHRHRGSCPGR